MRRFSQRNSLVTLSDINITPLLDLAFVLLIIFIITTPLLEQGISLKLPVGGRPDRQVNPNDVRTVEVSQRGLYQTRGQWVTLAQIERDLVVVRDANPNLFVYIRADENVPFKYVIQLTDRLGKNNINRFSFRTVPEKR